jgi:hypothetical protein
MRALKDKTPCAVLHRPKPSAEWELCYYTERISHAWRLQLWIAEEESKSNPRQQTVTILREDYDADRFKVLRIPKDFDPAKVPQAEPVVFSRSVEIPTLPPTPSVVPRQSTPEVAVPLTQTTPGPPDLVAKPVALELPEPPELAGAW